MLRLWTTVSKQDLHQWKAWVRIIEWMKMSWQEVENHWVKELSWRANKPSWLLLIKSHWLLSEAVLGSIDSIEHTAYQSIIWCVTVYGFMLVNKKGIKRCKGAVSVMEKCLAFASVLAERHTVWLCSLGGMKRQHGIRKWLTFARLE